MIDIVERLLARAERLKCQNASCQRICDLLSPEMVKFDSRDAPWDTYTVRMSVDHASSIRTQQKEIEDLTDAANELAAHRLTQQWTPISQDDAETILLDCLKSMKVPGDDKCLIDELRARGVWVYHEPSETGCSQ